MLCNVCIGFLGGMPQIFTASCGKFKVQPVSMPLSLYRTTYNCLYFIPGMAHASITVSSQPQHIMAT